MNAALEQNEFETLKQVTMAKKNKASTHAAQYKLKRPAMN